MNRSLLALAVLATLSTAVLAEEEIQLPPEVTPALRAACEADVRRLCIRPGATIDTVKACVMSKFLELGDRCRRQITLAGLAP